MSGKPEGGGGGVVMGLWTRVLILFGGVLLLAEVMHQGLQQRAFGGSFGETVVHGLWPLYWRYAATRAWFLANPLKAALVSGVVFVLLALLYRQWLVLWRNHILPRISGTHLGTDEHGFPLCDVDLVAELLQLPPASTFIGVTPIKSLFGPKKWEPVYLTERERSTHVQIVGKTGSGKTLSVLLPMALQDVRAGKGMVFISAKGSDEEIVAMKGIAQAAGRSRDLRVFALPAWNRPHIFTHSYNMLQIEPQSPGSPGGDPVALAERTFKALPLGDNVFYNTQGLIFYRNLIRAAHGMLYTEEDEKRNPAHKKGHGIPFNMRDIALCLKGVGASPTAGAALHHILKNTTTTEAARELRSQQDRLGREIHKVLSGLVGAVDQFQSPIVNAYDPDIIMEDVLEKNLILYVQLPDNLFKVLAPALGKVFLQDIQQEGALRQIYRQTRRQSAFSVIVDEFARVASIEILASLSQLRDSGVQFTLAHQSPADLEIVSKEFAVSTWDNTRAKILLNQDNPQLCEMVAKSIGTKQEIKLTVKQEAGPLLTSLASRDASSRQVESYRLHPNRIRALHRFGQAFVYSDETLLPVALAQLPADMKAHWDLTRKDPTRVDNGQNLLRFIEVAEAEERAREAAAALLGRQGRPEPVVATPAANKVTVEEDEDEEASQGAKAAGGESAAPPAATEGSDQTTPDAAVRERTSDEIQQAEDMLDNGEHHK